MARFFTIFILFIIISITLSLNTYAQDDKSVTLVVNGEGKTSDDAKQSALRNAIEQAFGTFISSKTDILNDQLIKDEIVSVSSGNIQKFEVLSEGKLPDGSYYSTLKATVSVSRLTSFCESKGISVEFKGSLFSFNIRQQKIYEENELKAIQDMSVMLKKIIDKSFDFKIDASQPVSLDGSNDMWSIPLEIRVSVNDNFFKIPQILSRTLSGLSMTKEEAENYTDLDKPVYTIFMATPEYEDGKTYFLRNFHSVQSLYSIFLYFKNPIFSARISNGVTEFSLADIRDIKNFSSKNKSFETLKIKYDTKYYFSSDAEKFSLCLIQMKSPYHPPLGYYDIMSDDTPYFALYLNPDIGYGIKETARNILSDNRFSFFYYLIHDRTVRRIINRPKGPKDDPIYLIASFLEIEKNDYDLIKIYCNDIRSLEEINKITEYRIIPNVN